MACLTTMPKQSNKISLSIYIFDRTPWIILRNKNIFLLFCFNSYPLVSFLYTFWLFRLKVLFVMTSSATRKRFIEKNWNCIYNICLSGVRARNPWHICMPFLKYPQFAIWWKGNKKYEQFKLFELLISYFFYKFSVF